MFLTGCIANLFVFDPVPDDERQLFEDERFWVVSDELTFNLTELRREKEFEIDHKRTESTV